MWPEYPYQTRWEYLCDECTGRPVRPLRYRKVTYRTGDYFPSRQETDTFARAGLDPVFPNWEMLWGILVAERIPAAEIEQLTIGAIVGVLSRLYPPQPPVSEKPAVAEPQANDSGQAETNGAPDGTPPWRDPNKNTEDRLVALAHANPECVGWSLQKLGGTIERSHTAVRKSQWNHARKENWELVEKGRIRRMDKTEAFAEGYRDPASDGWEPIDDDESDPESFQ